MLTILTGAIGSGKTTRLRTLYAAMPPGTAEGFASERVFEEGRLRGYDLVRLSNGERRTLCVDLAVAQDPPRPVLVRRRFAFDPEAFRFGERIVADALADPKVRCILLDEVGPLELEGRGFAVLYRRTLAESRHHGKDVVACVRAGILEDVQRAFPYAGPVRLG